MPPDTLYTVLFTFHSAQNLPIADMHNLSCDPFLEAEIRSPSSRHQEDDPPLVWRTPTLRETRDPTWNCSWVVSGVPASGFVLEMRVKDEDTRDRDDRLGKAFVNFSAGMLNDSFEIKERPYKILKRKGSVVPYVLTYVAALIPGQKLRKHNRVVISVKVLGRAADQSDRRVYTLGPNAYTCHFSPLLGSMVHRGNQAMKSLPKQMTGNTKKQVSASTFVANKLQLTGPTPPNLRHHYVGYNKFIQWLYSDSGVFGHILYHGLRKQYRTVYSYNKNTLYGVIDAADEDENLHLDQHESQNKQAPTGGPSQMEGGSGANNTAHPSEGDTSPLTQTAQQAGGQAQAKEHGEHAAAETNALARKFLELTQWGAGGRLYTYVLTLDAEWRFSETGDEFAIDFLSKHMMHANGAKVVTFSGEFFVRRLKPSAKEREGERKEGGSGGTDDNGEGEQHPEQDAEDLESEEEGAHDPDPSHYELIIDNNSGTYRPPKEHLPEFRDWLADRKRLGGLGRVTVMEGFDEKLKALKKDRKELKKRLAGGEIPKRKVAVRNGSSASSLSLDGASLSSGEVERAVEQHGGGNQPEKEVDLNGNAAPPDTVEAQSNGDAKEANGEVHGEDQKQHDRPENSHTADSGVHI